MRCDIFFAKNDPAGLHSPSRPSGEAQRFDIPRLLAGVDIEGVSENARQKLGFYAQAPTTLDEYYAPLHQRMFGQPYE